MIFIEDDLGDTFIEDLAAEGIAQFEVMLALWAEFHRQYGC